MPGETLGTATAELAGIGPLCACPRAYDPGTGVTGCDKLCPYGFFDSVSITSLIAVDSSWTHEGAQLCVNLGWTLYIAGASTCQPRSAASSRSMNLCLANSKYLCKSPSFHRLVNPGGNGTIRAYA